jgi:hypothetical protein
MDIAERGKDVIPFVEEKLDTETRAPAMLALFEIVYYLKLNGSVDLRDKQYLLGLMGRRLEDMEEGIYRSLADTTLRRIRLKE